MESSVKYIHDEQAHNLQDPRIILPVIIDILKPNSVIDIGCGIGTFLRICKEHGIDDIMGIDGPWVDKSLLSKNIPLSCFCEENLELGFHISKKYDLAICLEVVEHLKEEAADIIVESLINASDQILFSAAIPGQMGQNHLNEQWIGYWSNKFQKYGYQTYDVLRPVFWEHPELARWYKQNIFLISKLDYKDRLVKFKKLWTNDILNYVHPEYYAQRVNSIHLLQTTNASLKAELSGINNGEKSFVFYLKLTIKYLLHKLKFLK